MIDQAAQPQAHQSPGGAVQLQLLGQPRIVRADGSTHALSRKDAALLARLAAQGPCPRSVLAALLWPGADVARARSHLRQRLSRLNRSAGRPLFVGSDPVALSASVQHDLQHGLQHGPQHPDGLPGAASDRAQPRLLAAFDYGDLGALDDWVQATASALAVRQDRVAVPAAALQPAPRPERATAISLLRPPRLVGRAEPWSALREAGAAGRVAVLLGEPGTGKSRLLADFAREQGATLLVTCRPGDEQQPYALFTRLLQAALPAVSAKPAEVPAGLRLNLAHPLPGSGPPPTQDLQPQRLADVLLWALHRDAPAAGRTLAIDDLQHADAASLDLLLPVCETPATPALRWVLAMRPAEVPPGVQSWLDRAQVETAQTVLLAPLDGAGVHTLLDSLALPDLDTRLWSAALHRHTGGNPLFLLQVLMELQHQGPAGGAQQTTPWGHDLPVPQSTHELLRRRIAQLAPDARALLQVAALAGQDFDVAMAAAVRELHPLDLADAWQQLEAACLMNGRQVAHDLVAEAARSTLAAADAPRWHAGIARHLAARADPASGWARIATHWRAAGHWSEAARAFSQAAARIHKQLRKTEEAALLVQAADCHAAAGEVDAQGAALFQLFLAQWTRKHAPAVEDAMARLQRLEPTPRIAMWAQITRGIVEFDAEPSEASLALMVGAQALALAQGDRALALWLTGWEVGSLSLLNRVQDALQAVPRTLALVDALPIDAQTCSALSQCGITLETCGRPAQGLSVLQRAVSQYRSRGEEAAACEIECHQSICHYHLGQLDEAARLLEAGSRALARLNGGTAEPFMSDYYLARYWREQGRLRAALELMLAMLSRLDRQGDKADTTLRAIFGVEAGLAYVRLGQPHRARPYFAAPRTLSRMQGRVDGLLLEAEAARAAGHVALPLLQQALELVPQCTRSERWRWRVQLEMARELEPLQAIEWMDRNVLESSEHGIASMLAPSRLMLLHAQLRAGQWAAAQQQALLLEALLSQVAPMAVYAGEYPLHMSRAFDAAGDTAAAHRVLRRGLAWVDRVRHEQVPAAFQESFIERNLVNRQLHSLAQRLPA